MYMTMVYAFIFVFILCLVGTLFVGALFRLLGKQGYLGNLYPNVRGGIPRGVGFVPFAILALYFLPKFNFKNFII